MNSIHSHETNDKSLLLLGLLLCWCARFLGLATWFTRFARFARLALLAKMQRVFVIDPLAVAFLLPVLLYARQGSLELIGDLLETLALHLWSRALDSSERLDETVQFAGSRVLLCLRGKRPLEPVERSRLFQICYFSGAELRLHPSAEWRLTFRFHQCNVNVGVSVECVRMLVFQ